MIYKTFFGKHIDLSKLASVSDVKKISIQGVTLASFEISLSGCAPFACNRELNFKEYQSQETISVVVDEVQSQVDEIIMAWEEYKKNPAPEKRMSRDELAAMAMQSILQVIESPPEMSKEEDKIFTEKICASSYYMADEMIKQGEK